MPDTAEVLDQIAVLRGRERTVTPLDGGLTNINLKVTTADAVYVVRRWQSDGELLGIDRDAEHLNSRAAAEAGVGAPVVDYRPDLGVLVIDYLDGPAWSNDSFREPGAPTRAAHAIRALHEGPRFVSDFDMFTRQARYQALIAQHGFWLPPGYADFGADFQRVRGALEVGAEPTVPCNNDLLAANFVDDGERLWLIDYEYSGNNDACFELGNTSTECDLDDAQVEELVAGYFGAVTPARLARVRLQAIVSAYGWALWGAIQAATSPLDYDFRGWCLERYEKAARAFAAADFETLIAEVQLRD
ncbi:choline kinase family protein [Nocardioides speluncae]|uniref:choline kinase family protein n=1 Tax=Nocardioides speluncae TaxID=2670337 RepID=UPI0019807335|nr:choline kinase family protein [Nocardioides speluncae]